MCIEIKSSFSLKDLSFEDKSSRFSVAILLQSERAFKNNTIREKKIARIKWQEQKDLAPEFSCLGMCESTFFFYINQLALKFCFLKQQLHGTIITDNFVVKWWYKVKMRRVAWFNKRHSQCKTKMKWGVM